MTPKRQEEMVLLMNKVERDPRQQAVLHQEQVMPDQPGGLLQWNDDICGQREGN